MDLPIKNGDLPIIEGILIFFGPQLTFLFFFNKGVAQLPTNGIGC